MSSAPLDRPPSIERPLELLPKSKLYRFFTARDVHPFDPDAGGFSVPNSWWLAELSLLAYSDRDRVNDALVPAGFERVEPGAGWFEAGNTHCFAAHRGAATIVAFRGTEIDGIGKLAKDLLDSLHAQLEPFRPRPDAAPIANVHSGFNGQLSAVWRPLVEDHLAQRPGGMPRVWFTGHSLGGALATLATAYFLHNGVPVGHLYTFGSPRVGDQAFADKLSVPAFRFVHTQDGIVSLPPLGFGYRHVGTTKLLDPDGTLADGRPDSLREPVLDAATGAISSSLRTPFATLAGAPRWIPDHAAVHYAYRLWEQLPRA